MNSFLQIARLCFPLLLPLSIILSGCSTSRNAYQASSSTNSTGTPVLIPSELLSGETSPDILRPGNKISITFSGTPIPLQKHEEKIREDGYLSPPMLRNPVKAAGKTVGQLQNELQALYVPEYFIALTVTVTTDERWFFVGGEVKAPGRLFYSGETTVLRAIQAAGDFTPFGNRKKVRIIRASGKTETVNCEKALRNPKLDLPIYPGDQVIVRQRLW